VLITQTTDRGECQSAQCVLYGELRELRCAVPMVFRLERCLTVARRDESYACEWDPPWISAGHRREKRKLHYWNTEAHQPLPGVAALERCGAVCALVRISAPALGRAATGKAHARKRGPTAPVAAMYSLRSPSV